MLRHQMVPSAFLTLIRKSLKGLRHTLYKNNTLRNSVSKRHPCATVTHIYRHQCQLQTKDLTVTSTPTLAKRKSMFWLPRRATRIRNVLKCLQSPPPLYLPLYLPLQLMVSRRLKLLKRSLFTILCGILHRASPLHPSHHQQNNPLRVLMLEGIGIWI